jgi:hypothetical protein
MAPGVDDAVADIRTGAAAPGPGVGVGEGFGTLKAPMVSAIFLLRGVL